MIQNASTAFSPSFQPDRGEAINAGHDQTGHEVAEASASAIRSPAAVPRAKVNRIGQPVERFPTPGDDGVDG